MVGAEMVRRSHASSGCLGIQGSGENHARSIIGATLNRREGSWRVVCGIKAVSKGILVYAFLYHLSGF